MSISHFKINVHYPVIDCEILNDSLYNTISLHLSLVSLFMQCDMTLIVNKQTKIT